MSCASPRVSKGTFNVRYRQLTTVAKCSRPKGCFTSRVSPLLTRGLLQPV